MNVNVNHTILQWPCFRRHGCVQVLFALLGNADDSGAVHYTSDYLEQLTELSHITVSAILSELERQGVIERDGNGAIHIVSLPMGITPYKEQVCALPAAPATDAPPQKKKECKKTEKPKQNTDKRFVPPTLEEVAAYILLKGYHFSADEFIDHYESNGWKVGKNPMKKWKSACGTFEHTWKRNEQRYQQRLNQPYHAPLNNYQQQQLAARQSFANATAKAYVDDTGAAEAELLLPGM